MKTLSIFLLCMIVSFFTLGQGTELKEVSISPLRISENNRNTLVIPAGQTESIENYLSRNVIYPKKAVESFTQGTSVVQFFVSANGEMSDFKIINSVSAEIDEEVIRVLKTTQGMCIPGSFNGKPVAETKEVSVTFRLTDPSKNEELEYLGKHYFSKGSELFLVRHDPQKALKYFNKGIVIFPKDKNMLLMRGIARYEAGDKNGACQDWNRIKTLGGFESDVYLDTLCNYKGYEDMVQIIGK